MSYHPEPTSVAGRVLAYLSARPPGTRATNAELSHELGVPASSFDACLKQAVNTGLIHKRLTDSFTGGRSVTVWVLGPRAAAPEEPQVLEHEPEQEESTTTTSEPAQPAPAVDPVTEEIRALLADQPEPATGGDKFACALFNDGRLYFELGNESMTLQVEHTSALLAYLGRVAKP